ncbi:hypothetical protein QYM36_017382, partial [Artemia franciscana]
AEEKKHAFYAVFILDTWFVKQATVGVNRWRFLLDSLSDLDASLKNLGSRLYVLRDSPENVFNTIIKDWNVKALTFESDTEPYAKSRDETIRKLAKSHHVEVHEYCSHTLYNPNEIIQANNGATPMTYQKFESLVKKIGHPKSPLDSPISIPSNIHSIDGKKYLVPTLDDLEVDQTGLGPHLYRGGETEALKRLEMKLKRQEWICKFSKPQTSPNSLEPSTTVLSPYLKFGCISPRLFYHKLLSVISGKKHTEPPTSLVGQLLWREFFYTVGSVTPNFDQIQGNKICKQIPWSDDPELLEAWKLGKTGYPFIDAVMTQLRTEGWIHHLARHSVACFLTRGDLWQSWVAGVKVFDEYLLDADWSLNNANWMWLSASSFFYQFQRVYSPIVFGKKTDKNGDYIKKYLPKLKKFPSEYIYEPWKAPLNIQKAAGCIIGQDYPKPIVDHDVVRPRNLERMSLAYKGLPIENSAYSAAASKEDDINTKKRKVVSDSTKSKKQKIERKQKSVASFLKKK